MKLIGLDPEMRDRYPSQLSGGQQQRVGVARALAVDPPVMLMDEPFGAIDPINRERLQNEFLRLQAEIGKTVLFVTHDIDEAIKMGDRIAVLKEGGVLAQYATPAELLMAPADDFVEDFVGADRALKRLALMRVRDVSLWEAPLAHVGQASAEVRTKLEGAEVPHALLVDSERKPLGWLSERDLEKDTVPQIPDSTPHPVLDGDDILRDALSDLMQAETMYAPVTDRNGRIDGVLSVEIISDFLSSPEAKVEEHAAAERPLADAWTASARPLAQIEVRDPNDSSTNCVTENGTFCFGWAADNYDRYVTPTLEHLVLVGSSVVAGFLIAFSLAYLSHRRKFLQPGFTATTGILYTVPSLAFFALLLPITGRGQFTAIIALTAYALQIIYRNTITGLNNVPAGAKDAGRGMGMTPNQLFWRVELPLAVPEIVAGLRIATVSTVAIATLAFIAGGGGLGTRDLQPDRLQDERDHRVGSLRDHGDRLRRLPAPAPSDALPLAVGVGPAVDEIHPVLRDVPEDGDMTAPLAFLGSFGGAFEFIFEPQSNRFTGGRKVGGLDQVWEYTQTHLEISALALVVALAIALPAGCSSGTTGRARSSRSASATRRARSPSWP